MHNGTSFFRLVTLKIPGVAAGNTGSTFTFTDQADIRYARTTHLEVYFANDLAFAMPEQIAVIPDSFAPRLTLTLETNDPDDITHAKGADGRFQSTTQTQKWLPLASIHRTQTQNGALSAPFMRYLMPYKDLYITWQKSFLTVTGSNGFNNTADLALVLGVWYTFLDLQGKPIKRT